MSKQYLVKFTPIGRFFFGGSYSLGESFYAESLKFPQPTTVLGCLRNTILIQNGIVSKKNPLFPNLDDEMVKELTGTSKIKNLNDQDTNFGIIERISPVFIVKNNSDFLFAIPKDLYENGEGSTRKLTLYSHKQVPNAKSYYSGHTFDYAVLSEKDPKAKNSLYFGSKEFWKSYMNKDKVNKDNIEFNKDLWFEEEEIFTAHKSVGIRKGLKDGSNREDAYYVKIDYSLKKEYSFGVIVWVKDDAKDFLHDDKVILGGEHSTFRMEVEEINQETKNGIQGHPVMECILEDKCNLSNNFSISNNGTKLVAISPILVSEDESDKLIDCCEHRIVGSIFSTRNCKRENCLPNSKSQAARMIPAGSVFYLKDKCSLKEWCLPYKIGYNYVLKIGG